METWENSQEAIAEIIERGYAEGWSQRRIAKELNKAGLKTMFGHRWTQPVVSNHARKVLGKTPRLTITSKRSRKDKEQQQQLSLPIANKRDWKDDVLTILSADISDQLKAKVLGLVLSEVTR